MRLRRLVIRGNGPNSLSSPAVGPQLNGVCLVASCGMFSRFPKIKPAANYNFENRLTAERVGVGLREFGEKFFTLPSFTLEHCEISQACAKAKGSLLQ